MTINDNSCFTAVPGSLSGRHATTLLGRSITARCCLLPLLGRSITARCCLLPGLFSVIISSNDAITILSRSRIERPLTVCVNSLIPNRLLEYTYSKSPTENISVQQRDMLLNESPSGAGRFPMHCTIRQSLRRSFRLIANILPLANDTP